MDAMGHGRLCDCVSCFVFGAVLALFFVRNDSLCADSSLFCRPVMSVSFQRSVLKVKVFLQCLLCVSQAVFFEIGACAVCL